MKNKSYYILGVALIATLLTACSNQKFAFRQKVKADRKTAVVAVPKAKTSETTLPTEEATASESVVFIAPPSNTYLVDDKPASAIGSTNTQGKISAKESAKTPVTAKSSSNKKFDKATKLMKKAEHVAKPSGSIDARKWIIVGLILILIGVILALISGVLGGLLITIGFVIAIIGLIVMLMDNV